MVPKALKYDNDPEAVSQFIHSCRDSGVTAFDLVQLLDWLDQRRGALDGNRQKLHDSTFYALLLALGNFPVHELGNDAKRVMDRLIRLANSDSNT